MKRSTMLFNRSFSLCVVFVMAGLLGLLVAPAALAISVIPVQADEFVRSIGVNTHIGIAVAQNGASFSMYAYGNTKPDLQNLGVRHIRDDVAWNWGAANPYYADLNDLASDSDAVKRIYVQLPSGGDAAATAKVAHYLNPNALSGLVVEGYNEPDAFQTNKSAQDIFNHQASIWRTFKADPALKNVPILMPSLAKWGEKTSGGNGYTNSQDLANQLAALGIENYGNYANSHPYPGSWKMPEGLDSISAALALNQKVAPNLPMMATETVYQTRTPQTAKSVDEWGAGIYTPRLLFDLLQRGVRKTFLYELYDVPGEGGNFTNSGLYRSPGVPKPAGYAVKNLISLLQDSSSSSGLLSRIKPFDYSMSDTSVTLQVFQKQDGEYWVALWRPVSVGTWNGSKYVHNYPAETSVTLTLNGNWAPTRVTLYTLLDSPAMTTTTLNPATKIAVLAGARVAFVRIEDAIPPPTATASRFWRYFDH